MPLEVAGQSSSDALPSQTRTQVQPSTKTATANQELPWLPGLGQGSSASIPTVQVIPGTSSIENRQSSSIQGRPAVGTPINGARPLGTNPNPGINPNPITDIQPQSVLTEVANLSGASTGVVAEVRVSIPQEPMRVSTSPVAPAAFVSPQNADLGNSVDAQQSQPAQDNTQQSGEVVDTRITTVTRGLQQLPNENGQVWRTYDISPYTLSVQTNTRPEQAVVDWILKETGTELWFAQPMGIMSATREKLHVYHTPAIQNRIKPIVDRFVHSRGKPLVMGMRLMTIASPGWRASAFSAMQPVEVNSPGVEAWLMSKENAAMLGNMLRQRADYQERSNNDLIVADGQKYTMSKTQPVSFIRSLGVVNDGYSRYQPMTETIDVGYTLDFSALSSVDGRSIEAIVGFKINQIEQMQRVTVDLPIAGGQSQPYDLQIPQMVSNDIRERFRWPSDQVLVISCGVVATPGPQRQAFFGIPALVNGTQGRADALMFIEYKGTAQNLHSTGAGQPGLPVTAAAIPGVPNTRGALLNTPPRR